MDRFESLAHQFCVEQSKRELKTCQDLEQLRCTSLRLLELMEMQRQTFQALMRQGW